MSSLPSYHNHLCQLITPETLEQLLTSLYCNYARPDSSATEEWEWARYAIEMLIYESLVREKSEVLRKILAPPPPPPPPPAPMETVRKEESVPRKKKEISEKDYQTKPFRNTMGFTYSSSLISNHVNTALECRPQYMAEMELQKMAARTHTRMLDRIQNATPILYDTGTARDIDSAHNDIEGACPLVSQNVSSFPMIFTTFNNIAVTSCHNPFVDFISVLKFWREILHITVKRTKCKQLKIITGASPHPCSSLLSPETESIFLQELINIDPSGPQMEQWYLYFSLLYLHLKCVKKVGDCQLFINRSLLFEFLVKCCEFRLPCESTEGQKDLPTEALLEKFLSCLARLFIVPHQLHDQELPPKERGIELMFKVVIHLLQKRLVIIIHVHERCYAIL